MARLLRGAVSVLRPFARLGVQTWSPVARQSTHDTPRRRRRQRQALDSQAELDKDKCWPGMRSQSGGWTAATALDDLHFFQLDTLATTAAAAASSHTRPIRGILLDFSAHTDTRVLLKSGPADGHSSSPGPILGLVCNNRSNNNNSNNNKAAQFDEPNLRPLASRLVSQQIGSLKLRRLFLP